MVANRENELTGLDKEIFKYMWGRAHSSRTLSQLSADLMLVSDDHFEKMTASVQRLVERQCFKSDPPSFGDLQAKLPIYDDYTEAVMMLTKYSIR